MVPTVVDVSIVTANCLLKVKLSSLFKMSVSFIESREVLGIEAHFSKSLVLWGLSLRPPHFASFFPSQFPPCPSLPHFPLTTACPLCQASPVGSPITLSPSWFPMSACPVSMRLSLYFVRPDDSFVVIGAESYFIHLFCGEIVFATSNDIHRPQHFFS